MKRVDANGNTACYSYDAAHRALEISYPSGPNHSNSLTKYFTYDAATYSGTPMANAVGHLARAYTGSGVTTDLYFSYTSLGQTAETWADKAGPCQPNPPFVGCNGGAWGYMRVEVQPGCGWDISCHFFVGFGNLFVNNRPSGALELGGSLATGALVAAISGAGGVAATLLPNSLTIRPGCGAPLAAIGAGTVGGVLTSGSASVASQILPKVFEGVEGGMNLFHFAPAAISAALVIGAGVGGLRANGCF